MTLPKGDEIKNAAGDAGNSSDEQKNQSQPGGKETTQSQKTYSQKEVDTIAANVGRALRVDLAKVTTERDTLQKQIDTISAKVTQAEQEIETLNTEISELSKDDPDKIELVKLRSEAKAKLKALTAKETDLTAREAKAQKFERDQIIFEVADMFTKSDGSDTDPDSLLTAADRFKVSDREGLMALAEEKGWKLKTETPAPKEEEITPPLSGRTHGGGGELTGAIIAKMSPEEQKKRRKEIADMPFTK